MACRMLLAIFVFCTAWSFARAEPVIFDRISEPPPAATFDDYVKPYFPKLRPEAIDAYWRPYLGKPFEEGLLPDDLALSRERQKAGDCQTVLTLEMKGFSALYSDRQSDFASSKIREEFETQIVPGFSPGYRRCLAHRDLIATIEPIKREYLTDSLFISNLPDVFPLEKPETLRSENVLTLERGYLTLLGLAVCHRYPPAFSDLYELRDRLGIWVVFVRELLYFHEQAVKAGSSDPWLDKKALEAFLFLRRAHVKIVENGDFYKVVGSGGFIVPDRLKALCDVY